MIILSQFSALGIRLESVEDCKVYTTEDKIVNKILADNSRSEPKNTCHICGDVFVENEIINWHAGWSDGRPDDVFKGCCKKHQGSLAKPEPEPEVSEKLLPPTDRRLLFLKKLGYDSDKPCTGKEAERLMEVWKKKPTSKRLESDLKKTGYDGTTPETNNETLDKIHEIDWAGVPITEGQREKIKQICELIGEKDFVVPTGKMEASLMIDRLKVKAEQMGIDVPKLNIGFWSDE